jgi:hypothetical protein
LIVCGLIAFAMNPLFAQQNASSLVGSWEFSLTPKSASSADRPIPGLATFNSEGKCARQHRRHQSGRSVDWTGNNRRFSWYSFDHKGVHFMGLNNVIMLESLGNI